MKDATLTWTSIAVLSSGLALAACSSTPQPNANLSQARQTCATAQNDPTVAQAGPHELEDGRDALNTAQQAWSDDADKSKVDHFSYLATRYCETAQQNAKVRIAAIQATTTTREMTLGDMLFATGKADLNANGREAVNQIATFMRNYPDRTVSIVGFTDSTGSAKTNAALSQHRAEAVQQALVADGIDPSRIQARGMGPANPVASNSTASGRQKNRRVEVAISGQPSTISGTSFPK